MNTFSSTAGSAKPLQYATKRNRLAPRRYIHVQRGTNRIQTIECYEPDHWLASLDYASRALNGWCKVFPPHELHLNPTDSQWER
jgi:hypothetical protein